jgi:predicted RNA polymerase sigma factor
MEIQASRMAARTGPDGEPVRLYEQDRARWNRLLIRRGLTALERAETARLAGPAQVPGHESLGGTPGTYQLQAAIAACHARAGTPEETDWVRIAELYGILAERAPSPVVELNRAVAVSMAFGPAEGLAIVDALAGEPALAAYHLLPAVRGDLLERLGRRDEARTEFERAADLARNGREKALLLRRAKAAMA